MYMKETIKEDSIQIPDYIEGIPTDRKMLEERFRLIQSYMTGITATQKHIQYSVNKVEVGIK